ncbi:TPA: VOC family protein [Klebsiella variicola]
MLFSHMRIARPVSELDATASMYCAGLGLQQLGSFTDHEGFSGIMLGAPDAGWHLEFTHCRHHPVTPSPGDEDLLVLYYPQQAEWQAQCAAMDAAGFLRVTAFNPYWEANGVTFVDRDGYRTVLQNRAWGEVRSASDHEESQ